MRSILKNSLFIFAGNFFCALAFTFFIEPAGLFAGGCGGVALVLNHFLSVPTVIGVWGTCVFFLLLGYLTLGKEYAANALVGALSYPLCFSVTSALISMTGALTDDLFLCTVFAGICNGIGIGIILRVGASSGGTDVPAMVLNRKFGIPVSVALYAIDAFLLCLQIPFSDTQRVLYGLLSILVYTMLTGKVLLFGQEKLQIQIHSSRYKDISAAILKSLDHGCTLVHIQGGYTRKETFAVQTVVTKRQLFRVRETALQIDPQAFLIINPVSDVNGRGFTLSKHYEKES